MIAEMSNRAASIGRVLRCAVVAGLLAAGLLAGEVTYEQLLDPPPENWLTYGRTYDSQRHTPLDQITKENVRQLAPAWIFPMPGSATAGKRSHRRGRRDVCEPAQ